MSTVKTVAKNSLMQVSSTIVTKTLSLIFIIFVARYLGDIGFGKYSFVFAFLSFFTVFTTFGMNSLIIREVAKDKSKSSAFLVNSAVLKSFLSLASWSVIIILIAILKKGPEINLGIIIIGLSLLPNSIVSSFKAVFSAYEKMEYNTLIDILFRTIIVGLGLSIIFYNLGLIPLFSVSLFTSILIFFVSIYIYNNKIGKIKIEIDYNICRYLLKTSYAFALTGVFVAIYHRIDTVMLSIMKGDATVGWYSAAYGLTESFLFIPAAISLAVFPVLSRLYAESRESFNLVYRNSFKLLLLFALPVGMGVTILAERIIPLIYKPEFNNSIIALRVLIWAAAFIFLNTIMSSMLYSANKQKVVAMITAGLVILNIGLNYLFIPRYSYVGASWTTVVTEMLAFIYCYHFISKNICKIKIANLFFKSLIATLIMGFFLYRFKGLNLFLISILAGCLYTFILILLRAFTREDKAFIRGLLAFNN